MSRVVRPVMISRNVVWICSSVRVSTDDVASSSTSTRRIGEHGAGDRDALALAARQREAPFADDGVVAERELFDEPVRARHAAARTMSSSAASGFPYAMLARTVSEKRNASSNTMPISSRTDCSVASRTSVPSTRMLPSCTS